MSRRPSHCQCTTSSVPKARGWGLLLTQRLLAWLLLTAGAVVAVGGLFAKQTDAMATAGGLLISGRMLLPRRPRFVQSRDGRREETMPGPGLI
jgi:predicted hotdog family 3-hydroxylacyl-ACP dehydratase